MTPPNLVFVFPDQYRVQSMGFWSQPEFAGALRGGGDPVLTPNLDAFARESLTLTRATSSAPVCSPYRGMLFSGCYPETSGVPFNCGDDRPDCGLRPELRTFTDVLSDAGYACGYIGKYHLDFPHQFDPDRPDWYPGGWDVYTPPEKRHGIDFWHAYGTFDVHKNPHYWDNDGCRHDPKRWSPMYEADVACEYIRSQAGDCLRQPRVAGSRELPSQGEAPVDGAKPFALFVAMNPPHTPNASLDDCEAEDFRPYADRDLRELLNRPNVQWNGNSSDASAAPYYFAQVTGVDRAFGRILDAIDEAGIRDNTIVVFTSDHGELLCSHEERGKNRIWSECFDIPFLLRYPRAIQPQTDDLLLTPVDIMPTVLGLLGLDGPEMDGSDYSGLWTGARLPERPTSAPYLRNAPGPKDGSGQHRGYVPSARGLKTHRYTYAVEGLDTESPVPELYDDDADPFQMTPLPLEENGTLVKSLCDELRRHCERMNDPWSPRGSLKNETYSANRSPVQSDGVASDKPCGVMKTFPGHSKHEGSTV